MKHFISNLGLCSIIFLWSIQIPIIGLVIDGFPIYLFFVPLLIFLNGLKKNYLTLSISLLCFLYGLLFFQVFFQTVLLSSLPKMVSSIFVISFLLPAIYYWFENSKIFAHKYLIRMLKFFLLLQVFLMIIEIFNIYPFNLVLPPKNYFHFLFSFSRPTGFFTEPSHIAISLSLFYFLAINQKNWFKKQFGYSSIIILFIIVVLSPSASLFAVIILSFIIVILSNFRINGKRLFRFIQYVFLTVAIYFLIINYIPNIGDRVSSLIKFVQFGALASVRNDSVLAFIKGYQMASYALINYPLGVGFLNMEVLNEYSSVSDMNQYLFLLNKGDGASMLFKIISEFGIIGFIFYFGMLWRLIKLARNNVNVFEQAFLFAFIATGIRGTTYFDGSLLLGISIYVFHLRKKFIAILGAIVKSNTDRKSTFSFKY